MRRTPTLDADVAKLLEDEMHRSHVARLVAGFDGERMNALVDELEDAAVVEKARSNPLDR